MFVDKSRNPLRPCLPVVLLTAILLVATSGQSQTISSTLLGTVSDPSGNVVPRAVVVVTNESTGDQRWSVTDATGGYNFPSLLPGSSTVTFEAAGIRPLEA